jgi:3-dehydroquinate dehydratase-2
VQPAANTMLKASVLSPCLWDASSVINHDEFIYLRPMKVIILNGPNINLVGSREIGVYGNKGIDEFLSYLQMAYPSVQIIHRQSNVEGELINFLQEFRSGNNGIIFNPGGYTHTSIAIGDAVKSMEVPVIEVHLSKIFARESFRHTSYVSPHCDGVISGFGWAGYEMALLSLTGALMK